jgi:protein gp37
VSTGIEWTEETWNPVLGCRKVSPGCLNCYAEVMSCRLASMADADDEAGRDPGRKALYREVVQIGERRFTGSAITVPDALDIPGRWRKPRHVFINSMSDLFHRDVPDAFIGEVWSTMEIVDRHTYQVLTKRPGRMLEWFEKSAEWFEGYGGHECPHIWLGTSVENRQHGLPRIDTLRQVPAAVRFLSIEPLLEDLGELNLYGIHWVIVGGESGPGARPMDAAWVASIRDQCIDAGVPFFFKQWGGVRKKAAGRTLDGRTWSQMPGGSC